MANDETGAGHPDEQDTNPEGMVRSEEQTPEQEGSQHQAQGASDQTLVALLTPQEPAHASSDIQTQAMPPQGELGQEQQEAEERGEPVMGQPDDAVSSSEPAELPERETVSVPHEHLEAAGE